MSLHPNFAALLRALFVLSMLCGGGLRAETSRIKVLIVDGQNNHPWRATTPVLKQILEDARIFAVDISTTPTRPIAPRLPRQATPEQTAAHAGKMKAFTLVEAAYKSSEAARWAA